MEEVIILLNNINNRLDTIDERLEKIENKLNGIDKSTSNMDNHIQFVENVYDKIKQPLAYATNKINYFISSNDNNNSLNNSNLPELTT
jgi:archaellum component FlaC